MQTIMKRLEAKGWQVSSRRRGHFWTVEAHKGGKRHIAMTSEIETAWREVLQLVEKTS